MSRLLNAYLNLLQRFTLPVQMATAGTTCAAGDLLHQAAFEGKGLREIEWYKTRRMMVYGAFVFTPVANRWHALLAKVEFANKYKTLATRSILDMALLAPFACTMFYTYQGTMEGRPFRTPAPSYPGEEVPQGIYERLEERLWGVVQKNWMVFGPTGVFAFLYAPYYARPPIFNVVALGWNCFLASGQARGALPRVAEGKEISDRSAAVVAAEVME
ncbi:hypothetical protein JCM8097_006854 [Rhodosporidiobolus ruineniae]